MKAQFVVASTEVDQDGDQFSEEYLREIASQPILNQPIYKDFDRDHQIGELCQLEYQDGKLTGLAEIPELYLPAIVPGFSYDPKRDIEVLEDGTRLVKHCKIFAYSVTYNPSDLNCRLIMEEQDNDNL